MAIPPLTISPTIAPSSSTGADMHPQEQHFAFGNVSFGPEPKHWAVKIATDAAIALAVGLAAKFILERLNK